MGVIERIVVSDETLRQLELEAKQHGLTVAEQAAARLEGNDGDKARKELLVRMKALRDSLPPQTTDSLELLRDDRAGNRH